MKRVGDFLIVAAFLAVMLSCASFQYSLAISSGDGGMVTTPGEGGFTYGEGAVVTLTASPASGYRFAEWAGDVGTIANVNAASTTVTMNDDYSITATFIAQYALTVDSTEGGEATTPGEGKHIYDSGTVVHLVAEAEEGYKFAGWTGDAGTILDVDAASTTIIMEADYTITTNFLLTDTYLDKIGPGLWTLFVVGEGVEATVTDYGILVNIASDPVNDPEAGEFMGGGLYTLEGDFDIRMGYELTVWPEGSGVRVGLSAGVSGGIPNKGVNVERVGWVPTEWPHVPFREVYLVHSDQGIHGITGTDDLSGTLRICREGTTLSCYYSALEGWREIYRAEWPTENIGIRLAVWTHEYLFGGEEVSVLLRTAEIIEPSA